MKQASEKASETLKKETCKSNRSFRNFSPTLPKTFYILKMSKQAAFEYPK